MNYNVSLAWHGIVRYCLAKHDFLCWYSFIVIKMELYKNEPKSLRCKNAFWIIRKQPEDGRGGGKSTKNVMANKQISSVCWLLTQWTCMMCVFLLLSHVLWQRYFLICINILQAICVPPISVCNVDNDKSDILAYTHFHQEKKGHQAWGHLFNLFCVDLVFACANTNCLS